MVTSVLQIRYSEVYLIERVLRVARDVKSPRRTRRRYDSSGRRRESEQRRARVLEAARACFLADGYVATTVPQIAEAAGVSVEFVYKAFDSKAGVAAAVWQQALLGQGPRPAEERSDEVSSTAHDPREILRNWAVLSAEVSELGAPLTALIRAAAQVDDGAQRLFEDFEQARRERMAHNAAYLLDGGHVRPGLSADQVRDVLLVAAGELYESLVLRRGWARDAYIDVTYRFLEGALLLGGEVSASTSR
jgi:AcrR family transcriptional regulator